MSFFACVTGANVSLLEVAQPDGFFEYTRRMHI